MPEDKRRPRILIVENDGSLRQALRQFLSSLKVGVVCGEASEGNEGIREARRLRPDVVILDVRMPVMDGFAAAVAIREAVPDAKVLLFTNDAHPTRVARALELGIDGLVAKGGDCVESLPAAITAVLEGRKSYPERRDTFAYDCDPSGHRRG